MGPANSSNGFSGPQRCYLQNDGKDHRPYQKETKGVRYVWHSKVQNNKSPSKYTKEANMIDRLEIITDAKLLRRRSKKVSKWRGERVGSQILKFIGAKGIVCVGLAAPQLGIYERVFILIDNQEAAIFVNPRVVEIGAMEEDKVESCLSLPGRSFRVRRPTSITVKDAVRTKPFELVGWVARAFLHELDHLNGRLINETGHEEVEIISDEKPL